MRMTSLDLANHPKRDKLLGLTPATPIAPIEAPKTPKRVRQGEKPMNKLEAEWGRILEPLAVHLRAQSKRYRLANSAWYKPDWTGEVLNKDTDEFDETCWEVKGGKKMKGHAKSMLTLKVAASTWPEIRWILVWKENGQWQQQTILP